MTYIEVNSLWKKNNDVRILFCFTFCLPLNFADQVRSLGYVTSQGCRYEQGTTAVQHVWKKQP